MRWLLAELRATAGMLPYGLPDVAPPADLRARVLAHAIGSGRPQVTRPPARRWPTGWLAALSGLAAVALLAIALLALQLSARSADLAQTRAMLATVQLAGQTVRPIALLHGDHSTGTIMQVAAGSDVLVASLPP